MNKMDRTFGLGLVLGVCVAFSAFGGVEDWGRIEHIIMKCRHKEDPLLADDLLAYARKQGVSDEEMSARLVELARPALDEQADWEQRQLATGALWGLIPFGGTNEAVFVREIMRKTGDAHFRRVAISVGIQLDSGNWKTLVEEICNDSQFSSHERFIACEEAYQIGRRGDKQTREAVEKFLSGLADREERPGTQNRLRRWAAELKSAEKSAD